MAGNKNVTRALHHRYADNLKYNCLVGATHWEQSGLDKELPGAKPQFFFAPTQIKKRTEEWGRDGLMMRIGEAWFPFVITTEQWLQVARHTGQEAVGATYARVLAGKCAPEEGQILSI